MSEVRMQRLKFTGYLLLALALLLSACSGGPATLPRGAADEAQARSAAPPLQVPEADFHGFVPTLAGAGAGAQLTAKNRIEGLGSESSVSLPGTGQDEARSASASGIAVPAMAGLPALPQDAGQRQVSVAYTDVADTGSPAAKSINVAAGLGKTILVSAPATVEWAYYGLPTWATKASQTAKISGTTTVKANGFKSGVYVALANYSTGTWQFFSSIYNLTAPAELSFKPGANYISPGGNIYVLVAAWNGDTVEITGLETSGDDSNAAPQADLAVSVDLGYDGFATQLDASASSDADLSIVKYEFDIDDGAGYVDNGASAVFPAVISGVGGRLVKVRVTDEGGLSAEAQSVVYAISPGSLLPFGWYRARMNAGLGLASMGMQDVFGGGPRVYPSFFFEGQTAFAGYWDLRTKLPGYFDGWIAAPESYPAQVDAMQVEIDNAASLQDLLLSANSKYWAQHQISAQSFNPTLDATQPLAAAIAAFVTAAGGSANQAAYQAAVGGMPLPQQQALARVVLAANSANVRRAASFTTIGLTEEITQAIIDDGHGSPQGGLACLPTGVFLTALYDVSVNGGNYLMAGFPYAAAFFTGAAEIADAIDQLEAAAIPAWANVSLSVDTPAGRIVIAGTGADTHSLVTPDGHALLIDLGGADTYNCHAGANASAANGVSICLDLGNGNDTYNAIDDPFDIDRTQNPSNDNTSQQGAGRMGIGMLVDFGGNDDYFAVRMGQGSAVFGVGLLADLGGDDEYELEALGQGGAFCGIGILCDEGGSDTYDAWHKAQGWGGIMGIGLLADRGNGMDGYTAQPALDAQRPEYASWFGLAALSSNLSFCQGAANGLSLTTLPTTGSPKVAGGGGLGILFDGGSDDVYQGGAFAQGAAHFQGNAVLLELDGGDTYTAFGYAQGLGSNTGLGCIYDLQGTDSYSVSSGLGIAAGEGAGIGWLLDRAGTDTYDAAAVGLGAGSSNGFGYFVDYFGGDQYGSHIPGFENNTLGKGNLGAGNPALPCYGIFVDADGADTYALDYANMGEVTLGLPGDGASWLRLVDGTYVNGRGSGIDS